jgi:hypothetical protein
MEFNHYLSSRQRQHTPSTYSNSSKLPKTNFCPISLKERENLSSFPSKSSLNSQKPTFFQNHYLSRLANDKEKEVMSKITRKW